MTKLKTFAVFFVPLFIISCFLFYVNWDNARKHKYEFQETKADFKKTDIQLQDQIDKLQESVETLQKAGQLREQIVSRYMLMMDTSKGEKRRPPAKSRESLPEQEETAAPNPEILQQNNSSLQKEIDELKKKVELLQRNRHVMNRQRDAPEVQRKVPHKRVKITKSQQPIPRRKPASIFISLNEAVHILSGQVLIKLLSLSKVSATFDITPPSAEPHPLKDMKPGMRGTFECNQETYFFDLISIGSGGAKVAVVKRK